jgi:hypothetical protein
MSNGAANGINREERRRARAALRNSRNELKRARRAAAAADRPAINVRLKQNELELARLDLAVLKDRDNDREIVDLVKKIEKASGELKDETDAFERATEGARKATKIIRKADSVLKFAAKLVAFFV